MNVYIGAAVVVMAAYFVWLCLQMASHVPGGGAMLIEILVAIVLGVLGAAAGFGIHRRK